jgi:hypothetical protein
MQYIILKKIKSRLLAGMMFYLRLVGIIDTRPFTGMINVAIHQMPNQDINHRSAAFIDQVEQDFDQRGFPGTVFP